MIGVKKTFSLTEMKIKEAFQKHITETVLCVKK